MESGGQALCDPGPNHRFLGQPFCAGEYWQPDPVFGPAAFFLFSVQDVLM
jgi:hypothetical protein